MVAAITRRRPRRRGGARCHDARALRAAQRACGRRRPRDRARVRHRGRAATRWRSNVPEPEAAPQTGAAPMSTATLNTSKGTIVVELFDEDAPKTVENFRKLAQRGLLRRADLPPCDQGLHDPGRLPAGHRHRRPGLHLRGRDQRSQGRPRRARDGQRRPEHERLAVLHRHRRAAARGSTASTRSSARSRDGLDVVDAIEATPTDARRPPDRAAGIASIEFTAWPDGVGPRLSARAQATVHGRCQRRREQIGQVAQNPGPTGEHPLGSVPALERRGAWRSSRARRARRPAGVGGARLRRPREGARARRRQWLLDNAEPRDRDDRLGDRQDLRGRPARSSSAYTGTALASGPSTRRRLPRRAALVRAQPLVDGQKLSLRYRRAA